MSAPTATKWGSIVNGSNDGRKGRIGIYVAATEGETTVDLNIQIWFWSIYSCSDGGNTVKFNIGENVTSASTVRVTNKSISHTVDSGSGWDISNQTKLYEYTSKGWSKTHSDRTLKLYASFSGIDMLNGTMYASTTYTVPKKKSYTVSFNANGGSGAPSSQTKWYGETLTLSSTKPTRTGYAFKGWATSSTATSAKWVAGGSYTTNASDTLYAVWQANTYAVTYDANGGSGAPARQTKTYGKTLTLSSTEPTRTNYIFKGWGLSSNTSTVTYSAGGSYTNNSAITLYAVWELSYISPRITGLTVSRCTSSGTLSDSGTYALVKFSWSTDKASTSIIISYKSASDTNWTDNSLSAGATSGTVNEIVGAGSLDIGKSYKFNVTVSDSNGSSSLPYDLSSSKFLMDFLNGGTGIAFGKAAETSGVADFGLDANFNESVYGNVLGLSKLPQIPESSDFNNYKDTGCWAIYGNVNAETMTNIPVKLAGRLEVSSATGSGYVADGYIYYRQRYIPYKLTEPTYERLLTRNSDGAWSYSSWIKTTLSQDAMERVYDWEAIPNNTDLDTLQTPGVEYVGNNVNSTTYSNKPTGLTSGTFTLRVEGGGPSGQIRQILTLCDKSTSKTWERFYHSSSWGSWVCTSQFGGRLLWSGAYYMTEEHTATLSEKISEQPNGIVLVFSYFNSTAQNYNFNSHFISKKLVALHEGNGSDFFMTASLSAIGRKYLYIKDDRIIGHSANADTGTASSGITYANNKFVLRYVIGV